MARFAIQGTAQTSEAGTVKILQNALVEVKTEAGASATLYSAKTAGAVLPNPFQTSADGAFQLFVDEGSDYTARVYKGEQERTVYVADPFKGTNTVTSVDAGDEYHSTTGRWVNGTAAAIPIPSPETTAAMVAAGFKFIKGVTA